MEVIGKIYKIFEEVVINEKFKKKEFVLEFIENPKYPQYPMFTLFNDRTNQLNEINVEDEVLIHFNLKGKEWTNSQGKISYINTLDAWKIQKLNGDKEQKSKSANFIVDEDLPF